MIPNHTQNEIARRVGTPTLELARSLGTDPDTDPGEPDDALTLPPRDHPPMNESRVIRGTLPFETTTTCMAERRPWTAVFGTYSRLTTSTRRGDVPVVRSLG